MNNILKKVSAAVLSFTLLGAGTIAVNTIAPQSKTTLVAQASTVSYWKYCRYLSQEYSSQRNTTVDVYAEYYQGRFTGYYKHVEGRRISYHYDPLIQPC